MPRNPPERAASSICQALTPKSTTSTSSTVDGSSVARAGWIVKSPWMLSTKMMPAVGALVPVYVIAQTTGLLDTRFALIVVFTLSNLPIMVWMLYSYFKEIPNEILEAARMDGATPMQLFRLVYVPLMVPSLVAVGTYSLLLAWNEYLYGFLLLSKTSDLTLAVALGNFLAADDSPWELLMATGLIYALPPAAIYYAFKRYMVGGLTSGAVKS